MAGTFSAPWCSPLLSHLLKSELLPEVLPSSLPLSSQTIPVPATGPVLPTGISLEARGRRLLCSILGSPTISTARSELLKSCSEHRAPPPPNGLRASVVAEVIFEALTSQLDPLK